MNSFSLMTPPHYTSYIINGRYVILETLSIKTSIIVFKVKDPNKNALYALKVFLPEAENEFEYEKTINEILEENPYLVKSVESVSYKEVCFSLTIDGTVYNEYAYILIPFYSKGDMYSLISNSCSRKPLS